MILSLPSHELFEYVNSQANTYFPDKSTLGGTSERLILLWID